MQLFRKDRHRAHVAMAAIAIACAVSGAAGADDKVTRILWRDPGPIGAKDLSWGTGSPEGAPQPPFTLVAEETSGTKPKVDVTDENGTTWRVKFASATSVGARSTRDRRRPPHGRLVIRRRALLRR